MKELVAMLTLVVLGSPRAIAQSSSDSTMQALLAEVRQLRLALEKSNAVIPRMQAVLQRVQLQQDVVARTSRELEAVRNQITKAKAAATGLAEHAAEVEARAQQEQDPAQKKQMEEQVKRIRASALGSQVDAQLLLSEGEAKRRLEIEESKLKELDERLNALERMLEPQTKP